jgi:hypothetical protein
MNGMKNEWNEEWMDWRKVTFCTSSGQVIVCIHLFSKVYWLGSASDFIKYGELNQYILKLQFKMVPLQIPIVAKDFGNMPCGIQHYLSVCMYINK